jgi:hypothetical protein
VDKLQQLQRATSRRGCDKAGYPLLVALLADLCYVHPSAASAAAAAATHQTPRPTPTMMQLMADTHGATLMQQPARLQGSNHTQLVKC